MASSRAVQRRTSASSRASATAAGRAGDLGVGTSRPLSRAGAGLSTRRTWVWARIGAMPETPAGVPRPLTRVEWLICVVASIGFAFDIYELLMLPLILPP